MTPLHTHTPGATAAACTVPSLTEVASLSREELIDRLLHFSGCCHLDFTESFLASKSTDSLRHILVAACQHVGKGKA
jgi:hypothetical protein